MAHGKKDYTNSKGVWRLVAAEGSDVTSVAKNLELPHRVPDSSSKKTSFLLRDSGLRVCGKKRRTTIRTNYENPGLREYIEKIILHTNLFSDSDGAFIKLVSQKTDLILNRLGFCWPRLNKKHVEKMLSYCQEVGFI